jgi:hypothetical protein
MRPVSVTPQCFRPISVKRCSGVITPRDRLTAEQPT